MDTSEFAALVALCQRLPSLVNYAEQQLAYARLEEYARRSGNLTQTLQLASASPMCLFVVAEILAKAIIREESDPEREHMPLTIDEQGDPLAVQYQQIIRSLLPFAVGSGLPQYIANSAINLVSICLKYILTSLHRLGIFEQLLTLLFPLYEFDVLFMNTLDAQVTLVQPGVKSVPPLLSNRLKVLTSLIENVQQQTSYPSYFDYRRNMYTFKNNYLAAVLHVAVWYLKVLAEFTTDPPESSSQELSECLRASLKLLQELMTYPYTLHLQEYECDEDIRESSVGEIYFPSYFRNVTEDAGMLQVLLRLYNWYSSCPQVPLFQPEIMMLIKIVGRLSSANSYFFDNEIERMRFRQNAAELIAVMLKGYRCYDEIYTCLLLELPFRVLNSYALKDYDRSLRRLLSSAITVCQRIVQGCSINLESGHLNAPTKALDILNGVYDECKTQTAKQLMGCTPTEIRVAMLEILHQYIQRLLSDEAKTILLHKFKNYEREVDTFEEIFKPAVTLFKLDSSMNHRRAGQLSLLSLCPESLTLWTHFYTSVLAETSDQDFDREIAQNTLQLLNYLQYREGISILRLLSVVVQKVLTKVSAEGRVLSNCWIQLQSITTGELSPFLESIVQRCTTRLGQSPENVEYSLDVLSSLYQLLKRNKVANLATYTEVLKNILNDLERGTFSKVEFYKHRIKLYEIIYSLCLDSFNLESIYTLYGHVRQSLVGELTPIHFLKYLYDMAGLVGQVESHLTYRILMELFIGDMKLLEVPYLRSKASEFMQDEVAVKAFIRFGDAVVRDAGRRISFETHSPVGMELETLLRPAVEMCVKVRLSKRLLVLLRNFMKLCPLRSVIAIPYRSEETTSAMKSQLNDLLASYFESIHRLQDITTLFPYIKDSAEWLIAWYEEAMTRGIDLQSRSVSLRAAIESRSWKNSRERQNIARLLLSLGTYEPCLQCYPQMFEGQPDESTFVKRFVGYFTL